jgi:hypothetical protein
MPRKPTARPVNEHLSTLSRMIGQVEADSDMSGRRRARVKKLISDLMTEFQKEI